ncbi:MAG TPA: ribosome-associated translation inhibitor RaiA [Bryobacteraceae bacterium]|jgi:putative sigma-54 modulation protein
MNVSYKGMKQELPPKIQAKLDAKFGKLSKLLEKRGPKGAHVIVTSVRHLNKAEITVQFYDHQLVAEASDTDLATAIINAADKLASQAVKNRDKWQERRKEKPAAKREAAPKKSAKAAPAAPAPDARKGAQKIFRVNHHKQNKPMTLEEAMLEMDKSKDYLVYQDSEKGRTSMLVRRRDGHFDLIEG